MKNGRYQILLTNDDGIQSPGLWAAAKALSKIGYVTVAAPRDQASSTGRSLPITSDGRITHTRLKIGEQEWSTYAVGGTPAQSVLHGVLEIIGEKPDLVVAGINYWGKCFRRDHDLGHGRSGDGRRFFGDPVHGGLAAAAR